MNKVNQQTESNSIADSQEAIHETNCADVLTEDKLDAIRSRLETSWTEYLKRLAQGNDSFEKLCNGTRSIFKNTLWKN